jgi:hypothetical protein
VLPLAKVIQRSRLRSWPSTRMIDMAPHMDLFTSTRHLTPLRAGRPALPGVAPAQEITARER